MSRRNIPKEYYNFIVSFASDNGRMPTYHEIQTGLGVKSISTVYHHISTLALYGKLIRCDNGRLELTEYHFELVRDEVSE